MPGLIKYCRQLAIYAKLRFRMLDMILKSISIYGEEIGLFTKVQLDEQQASCLMDGFKDLGCENEMLGLG